MILKTFLHPIHRASFVLIKSRNVLKVITALSPAECSKWSGWLKSFIATHPVYFCCFFFCLSFLCRISWLVAIAARAAPPPFPLLPQWPTAPLSSRWTVWWGRYRAPTGPWVASWGLWTVWFSPPALFLTLPRSPPPPCPSLVPSTTGLLSEVMIHLRFDSMGISRYTVPAKCLGTPSNSELGFFSLFCIH